MRGLCGYYISPTGNIVNAVTGSPLKRLKGRDLIRIENKTYSVPKLLLSAFHGEPYRKQRHISYIDGNRDNLNLQNVRYVTLGIDLPDKPIDDADFVTAIRCYIKVRKRYNRMDNVATQIYLQCITEARRFFMFYAKSPYIDVFEAYLSGFRMCIATTAKEKGLTVRDCGRVIRWHLNVLIQDIHKDLKDGLLMIQPYQPRKKTLLQVMKEYNESRCRLGLPPVRLQRRTKESVLERWERVSRIIRDGTLGKN